MVAKKKIIELATCRRPHGVKGGFSLILFNTQSSILSRDYSVLLKPLDTQSSLPPEGKYFKVLSISHGPKKSICYLQGVDCREKAEAILPFSISLPRGDFPSLKAGEYYIVDLIDAQVIEHGSGKVLGKISRFYSNGPQDIVVIEHQGVVLWELPLVAQFFPVIMAQQGVVELIIPDIEEV